MTETTRESEPAWRPDELRGDPHANADKPTKVRDMFAAIAGSYDVNNRVHSLWRDQAWRREAVRTAGVKPGDEVLDCACGTGDLTQAFAKTRATRVVGLDFTPEMLEIAKKKKTRAAHGGKIEYIEGDAQQLPFESGSFDVVSIAFGIRNVQEPERALGEFARVLRPGGRLVVLEFGTPKFRPLRVFNDLYCGRVMPRTATLISRDRSGAYHYLPKSVSTFLSRAEMQRAMVRAGFSDVLSRGMTMGICVCYRGLKSGDSC